jgi:hypothetical protein
MSKLEVVNENPLEYPEPIDPHVTRVAPLPDDPYRPRRGEVHDFLVMLEGPVHGIVIERNYMLTMPRRGPDDHRTLTERTTYEAGTRFWFPHIDAARAWAAVYFPHLESSPPERDDPSNVLRRYG